MEVVRLDGYSGLVHVSPELKRVLCFQRWLARPSRGQRPALYVYLGDVVVWNSESQPQYKSPNLVILG